MTEALSLIPEEHKVQIEGIEVQQKINGDSRRKHLLSMHQFTGDDVLDYINVASILDGEFNRSVNPGANLLSRTILTAIMRQESTRTSGSFGAAMEQLGGSSHLISGMSSSSEAKDESWPDSYVAFATHSRILAVRTAEEHGPDVAAMSIEKALKDDKLRRFVPVLNAGDGMNEHPTQALGDGLTMFSRFNGDLTGKTLAVVGDHPRYRANRSLMILAKLLEMNVIAVETEEAGLPDDLALYLGNSLIGRTEYLDEAMKEADILYVGRKPKEYDKKPGEGEEPNYAEITRSRMLEEAYQRWIIDNTRLQQMKKSAIVMHPRPRNTEIHPDCDSDQRMADVEQMDYMVSMRGAIILKHLGVVRGSKSLTKKLKAS